MQSRFIFAHTKHVFGVGEMGQQLRAQVALLEDLGAVASIHMEAHTNRGSDTFLRHIPISRQNTQTHKKDNNHLFL